MAYVMIVAFAVVVGVAPSIVIWAVDTSLDREIRNIHSFSSPSLLYHRQKQP